MVKENQSQNTDSCSNIVEDSKIIREQDVWKIKGDEYIYRTRIYKELSKEEELKTAKKDIYKKNKKSFLLTGIELLDTKERVEIILKLMDKKIIKTYVIDNKKYTDEIPLYNIEKWIDYAIKKQNSDNCFVENELDWLASFFIAGQEGDSIYTLDKFIPIKELNVVKTEMIGNNHGKKVKYCISRLNHKCENVLEQMMYNNYVSNLNCGYSKNYKEFKKINWDTLKLSKQQKKIIDLIKNKSTIKEISHILNVHYRTITKQIEYIKNKIDKQYNMKQYKFSFNYILEKIIIHMDKQNKNFSLLIKYYCKKIKELGFDESIFLDICDRNFTKIDSRKLYGMFRWNYEIDIKLFCKIRNNIEDYINENFQNKHNQEYYKYCILKINNYNIN